MRSNVKAPSLVRQRNGLLDVANVVSSGDSRWEDGINFTPHGCSVIFGHDTKCWYPRGDKALQECPPYAQFYPYVLELTQAWSTVDLGAGPKELATEAFEMGTSAVLARLSEQMIADVDDATPIVPSAISGTVRTGGIQGRAIPLGNPHLADGLPAGAIAGANEAIGSIEAKLLDAADHTGSAGTIYMNPMVAALGWGALSVEDGRIYTLATGCRVVIDNFGLPNVYGHIGEVDVYLGEVEVVEATEFANNTYVVQAERMAVAVWNTCAVFKRPVQPTTSTGSAPPLDEVMIAPDDPSGVNPSAELWFDPDATR